MIVTSIDGAIVAPEAAMISVLDRGLLYGDGLFEVLRTCGRIAVDLDAHLARLTAAGRALHLHVPGELDAWVTKGRSKSIGNARVGESGLAALPSGRATTWRNAPSNASLGVIASARFASGASGAGDVDAVRAARHAAARSSALSKR